MYFVSHDSTTRFTDNDARIYAGFYCRAQEKLTVRI